MNKPASTSQPIAELLSQRWSPRAFDPSREISATELTALAEAARWAPSCYGAQPWSFIFCPRHAQPAAWDKALACLADMNQAWASNASLLIAAIGQHNYAHNDEPNRHHLYDTGAAAISLALQSEALDLRTHQMGGFDPAKVISSFGVPAGWDPIAMIAVGQQTAASTLPEGKMLEMEQEDRSRDELGSRFFLGTWGTGLS